jgi:hypothetical protein
LLHFQKLKVSKQFFDKIFQDGREDYVAVENHEIIVDNKYDASLAQGVVTLINGSQFQYKIRFVDIVFFFSIFDILIFLKDLKSLKLDKWFALDSKINNFYLENDQQRVCFE